mmetsp:Transcript_40622/g.67967  ORF Transcript_40622/g.67967 Transcript_40622/m.67967 type:complete len:255 (+) Transcript_40622:305-1069(+)
MQPHAKGKDAGSSPSSSLSSSSSSSSSSPTIEIYIVPEGEHPPPGIPTTNILRSRPQLSEEGLFIVRQTFARRSKELPAELSIEVVSPKGDTASSPPRASPSLSPSNRARERKVPAAEKEADSGLVPIRKFTPKALDAGLSKAGLLVAGASNMFSRWASGFKSNHVNKLPLFDQKTSDSVGGDPNIRYYHSYWEIGEDEALVIDAKPPKCQTWNFQLNNHWMESLDYRFHNIHTNKFLARYRKDGSVRVIVSHR